MSAKWGAGTPARDRPVRGPAARALVLRGSFVQYANAKAFVLILESILYVLESRFEWILDRPI